MYKCDALATNKKYCEVQKYTVFQKETQRKIHVMTEKDNIIFYELKFIPELSRVQISPLLPHISRTYGVLFISPLFVLRHYCDKSIFLCLFLYFPFTPFYVLTFAKESKSVLCFFYLLSWLKVLPKRICQHGRFNPGFRSRTAERKPRKNGNSFFGVPAFL